MFLLLSPNFQMYCVCVRCSAFKAHVQRGGDRGGRCHGRLCHGLFHAGWNTVSTLAGGAFGYSPAQVENTCLTFDPVSSHAGWLSAWERECAVHAIPR